MNAISARRSKRQLRRQPKRAIELESPPVTALTDAVARDFTRYYQEAAKKILALAAPLSDEQLWARPYPYGNSIGHLLLHLTGNLNFYIGAEIGGTGYVRNRPLEFSDPS